MENHQSLSNIQCVELERLATAAASMDYNSPLSPGHTHNSTEIETHNQVIEPVQNTLAVAHTSRTQIEPHVFSYIDPSHINKEHPQFLHRAYDSFHQQGIKEQAQTTQSISGSRIVLINSNDSLHHNIQFGRNAPSQFTFYEEYQNDNVENSIQTTYSQSVVTSPTTEIIQCKNADTESTKIRVSSDQSENIESSKINPEFINKNKRTVKRTPSTKSSSDKNLNESETVESGSNVNSYLCKHCSLSFETETAFKEHQNEHNMPKRNGLSLELKIEIIKRVNSGERKADMAEEYGVNTSTIKSIMKKADSYLNCWKKGMFKPDSKRLKGPKREDVEEAIFFWYQQAIENETPVSGPILCAKALDFAKKLGHLDFKPTHGWLDRFKKRKKIVFGRNSSKRRREEKMQESYTSIFPKMLSDFNDYEPQNIFAIEFFGIYYRTLPNNIDALKGLRCAGGVKSKERFSIVLCTNMIGSEKFPLLVVGRSQPSSFTPKNRKNLPVHFVVDQYSWLTSEIISSWLLDMDSWFVQQGRKVLLLGPPSPIYSQLPKFRAVKLIILPPECPSPLHQVTVPYFKKYYRKKVLEELLLSASRSKPPFTPQLPVITCLHLLASTWQTLSDNIIASSFQRAGLSKYCMWGMPPPMENPDASGAQETFRNAMQLLSFSESENTFDEYVHFDDNVQVCNLMEDEDIIAKVRGIPDDEEEISDESQDKIDKDRPSFADVETSLGVLRKYIQYQEGAQEMFGVFSHLEYIIYKNVSEDSM